MRNKSLTRFAAFFVAVTMLFACLQVIAQPAANDSGHTYVLVDQPTDGGVYLMISRQSGSNFAVSGTAMPDGEGLVPVEVGVAGDYVVTAVPNRATPFAMLSRANTLQSFRTRLKQAQQLSIAGST